MMMTTKNAAQRWALLAMAMLAIAGGCRSSGERTTQVDERPDASENNRLLVRMALAENVYNGIATERAVYPRDFDHGSATLNELGTSRVEMLEEAYRDGSGRITVLRGDASDDLHAARVATVRQHFADAGLDPQRVHVVRGEHSEVEGDFSDRALLSYDRMMQRYAPLQQQGAPKGSVIVSPATGAGSK